MLAPISFGQALIVNHEAANQFSVIPAGGFADVRDFFGTEWPGKIFMGTRSHGSQIGYGLELLESLDPVNHRPPYVKMQTGLAGQSEGDVFWTDATRQHLQANPDTKVVIWAMCSLITGILSEEEINQYLFDLNQLESEYPDVFFVYWTDIIDEDGALSPAEQRNEMIRSYCRDNDKILYDFADITARNPEGTYYPGTDEGGCTWCQDWCIDHGYDFCSSCDGCPHSVCFDCFRKAQAFWWLLTQIAVWDQSPTLEKPIGSIKSYYRDRN